MSTSTTTPGDTAYDTPYDVVAIGRIGVDIYPLQHGVGLEDVRTFGKFLGGSATNVAVAAARHGHRHGAHHPHRAATRSAGTSTRRCAASASTTASSPPVAGPPTPVTFCEIFPPDDFPLYFYRYPNAPDLQIEADELPLDAIRDAGVFWSPSPACRRSRAAPRTSRPGRPAAAAPTPCSTSTTARCSGPTRPRRARRSGEALEHVTVAVGNREECEVAVGETEPQRAADALLERGVELAVVKQGPKGVLAATRDERVEVPPVPVEVVNGLGAGDAFGGALCHGLLAGWDLRADPAVRQRRRRDRRRPGWSARPRCRPRPRSRSAWPARPARCAVATVAEEAR